MYNKLIMVGNLTRDIELRYSQAGSAIAKSAIATSRKFTKNGEKKEEVCFVDITLFGRSGEIANQYLRKGSKILIEGRLNFEQWVDQNGQKRSKHSVIVESMQMLDSKGSNSSMEQNSRETAPSYGGGNYASSGQQQSYQQSQAQQQPHTQNNRGNSYQEQPSTKAEQERNMVPEIDISEDEIPF